MKKNVLKGIEKIKETQTLSEEIIKKIIERIISNCAIAISIVVLILLFFVSSKVLQKEQTICLYNFCAIIFLLFALILLEISYKKDSDKLALCGIEILITSIFTLFSPYIFFVFNKNYICVFIAIILIYSIIKAIKIYLSEKNLYLSQISDIKEIIKKESNDEKAQEEKKKIMEMSKKKQTNKTVDVAKNKKTSTKKATTSKNKDDKKTTTEKKTATKSKTKKKTTTYKKVE